VDVDAEYVARRTILLAQQKPSSARGIASGRGGGVVGGGGSGSGGRFHTTSPLARLICPDGGGGAAVAKELREVLERFLQALVRVTGGDTLLPDQLADAALLAFESVAPLVRQSLATAAKWAEKAAYDRDPDLAKKRAAVEEREFMARKKAALTAALGPVDGVQLAAFDAVAKQLVQLQDRLASDVTRSSGRVNEERGGGDGGSTGAHAGTGAGADAGAVGEQNAAVEFGADLAFVPAGGGGTASSSPQQGQDTSGGVSGSAAKLAAGMKATLSAATATEIERRSASAAAHGAGTSPLDAEAAPSSGLGALPAAEACAAEQLTWLKDRSVEHSGAGGWEETAQGVARALLSSESKSDDEVAIP
jgi:hypothetical protein